MESQANEKMPWWPVRLPRGKRTSFLSWGQNQHPSLFGNVTNGKTKRIMIIDDDEALRTILFEALSFMGYEVSSAGSGEEALRFFLKYSFDLVITDFKIPGMDGCALSLNIKEKSPNTPVILITGLDLDKNDIRKRLEESPVDSVILKPFKIKNMQRSVQSLLSRRTMKT